MIETLTTNKEGYGVARGGLLLPPIPEENVSPGAFLKFFRNMWAINGHLKYDRPIHQENILSSDEDKFEMPEKGWHEMGVPGSDGKLPVFLRYNSQLSINGLRDQGENILPEQYVVLLPPEQAGDIEPLISLTVKPHVEDRILEENVAKDKFNISFEEEEAHLVLQRLGRIGLEASGPYINSPNGTQQSLVNRAMSGFVEVVT